MESTFPTEVIVQLDASKVLAAALEQMDDIIAASTYELENVPDKNPQHTTPQHSNNQAFCSDSSCAVTPDAHSSNRSSINRLLDQIKKSIDSGNDTNDNYVQDEGFDASSAEVVYKWLQGQLSDADVGHNKAAVQSEDVNSMQKIQQLESDKKNLILQASVLADQVEAQSDKIGELERLLDQKKDQMNHLEQNLHQEMLTRSTIESSKLELMTELSNLRLRLTASERDRKDSDDKCRKLENELLLLHARLTEKEVEYSSLRNKVIRNGTIISANEKNTELEKLQTALDTIMISNDEKDQKIEDLCLALDKYKKLQEIMMSNHARKASETCAKGVQFLDGDTYDFSMSSSIHNDSAKNLQNDANFMKPPHSPRFNKSPTDPNEASTLSWKDSFVSHHSPTSVKSSPAMYNLGAVFHKSSSVENICPSSSKATTTMSHFGTIPRQTGPQALQHLQEQLQQHNSDAKNTTDGFRRPLTPCNSTSSRIERDVVHPFPNETTPRPARNKSTGVSFGKGFFKLRSGKRSSSAPELAPKESVAILLTERENGTLQPSPPPYIMKPEKDKGKKFLKFFSKWKRTGSQNIEKIEGDFKRGGIRATAGARLGWTREISNDPDIPFERWSTDFIVEWLHKIGLAMYISECKRWMCNGEQLYKASPQELEKELNIKNPMHRKKLVLAIKSMTSNLPDVPRAINSLDNQWVIRWLDDVGLPQYKDAFTEARIDGRVLHYLTVDDLLFLKVTSQLHHISIKRGIQVLRDKSFEPHCLIRRSQPSENKYSNPESVALWTNHRVMEWLRTVDLSEYAPNLRGSGVHGALIVYEPMFNTDLFATLLNIPPTKTLLRRHLATHFKHVVGTETMQLKRDKEIDNNAAPLSPSAKIKVIRKNQFVLKKKRKGDLDSEDYICPMDIPIHLESPQPHEVNRLVVRRNSDPSPQEPRHLDLKEEETVEKIGAVSKEISTLTTLLQGETLLKDAPTTVV